MKPKSPEQQAREFFSAQALAEGISLRAYCKKYGIIYESFYGRDDYEDLPAGKVYLSQIESVMITTDNHEDSNTPSE